MKPKTLIAAAAGALLFTPAVHGADRDHVEDADFPKKVTIAFNGSSATVTNRAGVTITPGASASHLAITSAVAGVEYVLTGSSANGYVEITSTQPSKVTLDGVSLTSPDGPALSLLSAARNFVVLADGTTNTLADNATSTRGGSGALFGSGPLIVSGNGRLSVAGLKSHAISTDSYFRALGGEVTVTAAAKDGVHANAYFRMDQGALSIAATGDGIDADAGHVLVHGGSVHVRCATDDTRGIRCDGPLAIHGGTLALTVDGVQSKALSTKTDLTITGGSLAVSMAGAVFLETVTGTTTYTDPSYSTALKSDANIAISGGSIAITHSGLAGKGISAGGNVTITGGTVDVMTSGGASASFTNSLGATDIAAADCIKANGTLSVTAGTVIARSTGTSGDCLSADTALAIGGGNLSITVGGASGDGIASRQTLAISGGTLAFSGKGAQSKALKSTGAMTLSGGSLTFAMSGAVVLELVSTGRYAPSYCTAIKCDSNLTITHGSIAITHTGQAGKGISANGSIAISGGTTTITTSGANTATFTNASGSVDLAAADCLTADGNLTITGGTVTAASSGGAADAISCDGIATFGTAGVAETPVISGTTTGARVLLSGTGMSADYANPKAFRAGGNFTINGGKVTAATAQNGGEGIESKAILTIAGGTVEATSYDDGLNATTRINISGGSVHCHAANNDGIDSNGTFNITGGVIVTSGSNAPEEGFDCDANNFTITGGILVGTGGATSTPTAATSTQRSVIYKGAGTANVILQVKTAAGVNHLVYKIPRTYSGGTTAMTMLFSNSGLVAGTTYSIVSGATVTGGTDFHGLSTGATVTGGTTLKTFTPTNMVTTVQ